MGLAGLVPIGHLQASALADPLPRNGVPVRDPMKGRTLPLVEERQERPWFLLGEIQSR